MFISSISVKIVLKMLRIKSLSSSSDQSLLKPDAKEKPHRAVFIMLSAVKKFHNQFCPVIPSSLYLNQMVNKGGRN